MKLLLRPGLTSSHPADSYADILDYKNQSPSGIKIAGETLTGCTVT